MMPANLGAADESSRSGSPTAGAASAGVGGARKKKKYNARFPPARIKKIMQSDEDVGKVAAAVPVIISRALELFVETLMKKANDTVAAQNRSTRTLAPSHLKMCINSVPRFDFLKELVSDIPDLDCDRDEGTLTSLAASEHLSTGGSGGPGPGPGGRTLSRQGSTNRTRGRPRKGSSDSSSSSTKPKAHHSQNGPTSSSSKRQRRRFVDDVVALDGEGNDDDVAILEDDDDDVDDVDDEDSMGVVDPSQVATADAAAKAAAPVAASKAASASVASVRSVSLPGSPRSAAATATTDRSTPLDFSMKPANPIPLYMRSLSTNGSAAAAASAASSVSANGASISHVTSNGPVPFTLTIPSISMQCPSGVAVATTATATATNGKAPDEAPAATVMSNHLFSMSRILEPSSGVSAPRPVSFYGSVTDKDADASARPTTSAPTPTMTTKQQLLGVGPEKGAELPRLPQSPGEAGSDEEDYDA